MGSIRPIVPIQSFLAPLVDKKIGGLLCPPFLHREERYFRQEVDMK
jgi:hypothetical protein